VNVTLGLMRVLGRSEDSGKICVPELGSICRKQNLLLPGANYKSFENQQPRK